MNQQQETHFKRDVDGAQRRNHHKASGLQRCVSLGVATVLTTVLLVGCGGGGGGDSASLPPVTPVTPVTPPTPPTPAPEGLLTDDQLGTATDANAALVDDDTAAWFGQNAKTIRSLTIDDDFSDLDFMSTTLQNKRLVMLGESGHGVKEYSQAKMRLIKYLHEEQDFNLLAFEGGMFDCENAQRLFEADEEPRSAMGSCLFGVWQTETLLELFEYIQSTQSSATPLRITGFDVQGSGFAASRRANYTAGMVNKASPTYAAEVLQLEQEFFNLISGAIAATPDDIQPVSDLTARLDDFRVSYGELADYLQANATTISADGDFSERDVLIAAQYARTSPYFAEQVSQRFEPGGGIRPRDTGMAENFIALATELYPNEKIIGWAHNEHVRHQGAGFLLDGNMGALVHDQLEDDLYTIGFYMYRGEHAFNDRSIQQVAAPLNNSLEAIFYSRRLSWLFLDIENSDTEELGAAWLSQDTPTFTSGEFEISLNLSSEYDGLFVIDTVTPPDYL